MNFLLLSIINEIEFIKIYKGWKRGLIKGNEITQKHNAK